MLKKQEISDPDSCLSKAGDDEPLFVLRGQDVLAPEIVCEWAEHLYQAHLDADTLTPAIIAKYDEAFACARAMHDWNHKKTPD